MFRSEQQQNFSNIVRAHMRLQDGPLLIEGGTGLGKTRAYLAAVMHAASAGQRIAVVLPTHQLIDQMLASADLDATRGTVTVGAFRPARSFERRIDYEANKRSAGEASVMLCTAASVIIDHRLGGEYNGSTERDYILFDEADQLPDMAALQSDFSISAEDLRDLGIKLTNAQDTLNAILKRKARTVEPETRAAAKVILEAIEQPAWYQTAGIDDDGNIVLTHKLPGRLLKKISNRGNVAFVSATLTIGGTFNDFRNAMGIERESTLSSVVEPLVHGKLDFHSQPLEVDTPEWIDAVVAVASSAPRPVLIATTSHELSASLGERMPDAVVRDKDETAAAAASRTAGVLIAAGAWAGLDTPTRWRSIVVPRIPFGQPLVIEGEATTSYLDARNTALRRLRQVIGRGLRTPDAVCSIYILDRRVEKLSGFIPDRFVADWIERTFLEGVRKEFTLSKSERCPAVRRAALKHYGCRCMACGFAPRVEAQLEVHHLDPIAEGERRTRLEDVVVLCANCHRFAHSTNPPLPMEILRQPRD
jgi:Rad3-related DNA helicase